MSATQIITFIAGSLVVIFGAYFATYLVARGSQKSYRSRAIQVLDRFSLSKDKSLMLIAVYDKIYLVAFAAGSITLLDHIDPETAADFAATINRQEDRSRPEGGWAGLLFSNFRHHLSTRKDSDARKERSLPFEAYLNAEVEKQDNLDFVYQKMQNRKEKEGRDSSLGGQAYSGEDDHE